MAADVQFGNLPRDWEVTQLGDHLIRLANGLTAKQEKELPGIAVSRIETISDGTVNFEKVRYVRELDTEKEKKFLLQKGDLLFSHINSDLHLGKTAVYMADKPLLHGMNLLVMRPNPETLDSKYLHYYLNLYRALGKFIEVAQHAVNQSSLNQKKVNAVPVPLPKLETQQRIVAEIEKQFSRLDEAVASLKRVKANLKRYKAAVLKAAVEGKLTEEWRKQNPNVEPASKLLERILAERRTKWEEAELAKVKAKGKKLTGDKWKEAYCKAPEIDGSELPSIPETWFWSSLAGLGTVIGGLTKNRKRNEHENRLPYLRVANVYANELRLDEIKEVGVGDNELEKLLLKSGDLLIVEGNGSPDQIGRLAIWDGSITPCVHQNHLIKVRLLNGCSPAWSVIWLLSPDGRECIRNVASSTSGLYTLSTRKVSALPVPLPPISEQKKIVAHAESLLSVIDGMARELERSFHRASMLRNAILGRAFAGKTF